MCLSVKIERPSAVLAEGEHLGFEWAVVHNDMGHRCGYIKVPPGHPWYGKGYDEPEVSVHGGLTFARSDVPCDKGGPDDGYWFGFDCAHCDDAPDPDLPRDSNIPLHFLSHGGVVRSQAYVESQCRHLCEQAAAAMKESV